MRRSNAAGHEVGSGWRAPAVLRALLAALLLAGCLNPRPEELPSALAGEPGAADPRDLDQPEGSRGGPAEDVSEVTAAPEPAASPPANLAPAPDDGDADAAPPSGDAGATEPSSDAG